ncbi:hypothetical protein H4W00_001146 [Psychrobacter sp. PL19]|uniref:hypothetical protein n=1 Tax=Psychrobacter sp. PL19 TaxID=2760711 RepID=UPI001AE5DB94
MKILFIAFLIFFQINPAFSYDENDFMKKFDSLNTTFIIQSTNFFSEVDKLNKLAKEPNVNSDNLQLLYVTSAQSLCITVIALEKSQSLIGKNPQVIGSFLTKDDVNEVNYKTSVFKRYLKEFGLDNQGCKDMMPYTYDSIMNN